MRSFIAASTSRKFFLPVFFTYSIRVNKMPELPEMNRPGSIKILSPGGLSRGTSRAAYFSGVRMFFASADFHQDSGPLASAGLYTMPSPPPMHIHDKDVV